MAEKPEQWKEGGGEGVSARKLNQQVDAILRIMSAMGWDLNKFGDDTRRAQSPVIRLGVVEAAGPGGLADYTDERYWVRMAGILAGSDVTSPVVVEGLPDAVYPNPTGSGGTLTVPELYTVTNLAELLSHTHYLAAGDPVLFVGLQDAKSPSPLSRYVMYSFAEGGPEIFGQVHMGVANLTKGWAFLPLVNP